MNPWKAAHDALRHYHAVRRSHTATDDEHLAAWAAYIAALREAQRRVTTDGKEAKR